MRGHCKRIWKILTGSNTVTIICSSSITLRFSCSNFVFSSTGRRRSNILNFPISLLPILLPRGEREGKMRYETISKWRGNSDKMWRDTALAKEETGNGRSKWDESKKWFIIVNRLIVKGSEKVVGLESVTDKDEKEYCVMKGFLLCTAAGSWKWKYCTPVYQMMLVKLLAKDSMKVTLLKEKQVFKSEWKDESTYGIAAKLFKELVSDRKVSATVCPYKKLSVHQSTLQRQPWRKSCKKSQHKTVFTVPKKTSYPIRRYR